MAAADRDRIAGEAVVATIKRQYCVPAIFVECDVSSEKSVQAAVKATVNWASSDGLDILVNSAGVNLIAKVTDTELERWDRAQHVNLRSTFLTARACLPHLMASGKHSSIVSISSVQATHGVSGFPACEYKTTVLATYCVCFSFLQTNSCL